MRYYVNGPAYGDERITAHDGAGLGTAGDHFYIYRDPWTVHGIARASGFVAEEYAYPVYGDPTLYENLLGDGDADGDVDDADGWIFPGCVGGSGVPLTCDCDWADFDFDGDVDSADQAAFNAVKQPGTGTGPGPGQVADSPSDNPYFFTSRWLDILDIQGTPPSHTSLRLYDYRARTYDPPTAASTNATPPGTKTATTSTNTSAADRRS